jgi:glucosamine kinase
MRYFAGIDGGQSSTSAVIAGEDGTVLAYGAAGPADEVGEGLSSTRLRDALQGALADAVRNAGIPPHTRFEAIVAGVSGYDGTVRGIAPDLPTERFLLLHDAPVAHAGALEGAPGIVVIAGTGSVVFGVDRQGNAVTAGGWGYLFGDDGGAFGIGAEALRAAAAAEDAADVRSPLLRRARSHFGATSMRAVARAFYGERLTRAAIASFAPLVVAEAAAGTQLAVDIALAGAVSLVEQARVCAKRLRMRKPRVAAVGGMLEDAWYAHALELAFKEIAPSFAYVAPLHEPAVGALILAYREARVAPPKTISQRVPLAVT